MGSKSALKLRKRRVMRRKEARGLMEEAAALLGGIKPTKVERAEFEGIQVYLFDGAVLLVIAEGILFPTLNSPSLDGLPAILVDMGAVPYIAKGADVMVPGVVEVQGDFEEGELVVVRDIRHRKALAVGLALASSEEMRAAERGKAVENLHYVGDKLWRAYS